MNSLFFRFTLNVTGLVFGIGIFQGMGGFMELENFDKYFVKKTEKKKGPAVRKFRVFSSKCSNKF